MPSFAYLPTEIETEILGYLTNDKQALYSTIRVCRAWYEHTNGLLWQHFSALDLAAVQGLSRRQHYADKVVKLEVSSLTCYPKFRFLSFPALTEVSLGAYSQRHYRPEPGLIRTSPFLRPTLRTLHLTKPFVLTEDAMDLICLSCPLLDDLELSCQRAFNETDEYLIHAKFDFPKLLRLVFGWDFILSRLAIEHLSGQLPSLEYLDVGYNYLGFWREPSGPAFPRLRYLSLASIPSISSLDLYVLPIPDLTCGTDES
jgi:hypothetical protein